MPVNSLYQNDYNIWHKSFLGGGKGGGRLRMGEGCIRDILYSKYFIFKIMKYFYH